MTKQIQNPRRATVSIAPAQNLANYDDLIVALKKLSTRELKRPITALIGSPGNYLNCPVASLVSIEVAFDDSDIAGSPLLHFASDQLVFPRQHAIAFQVCKALGIQLSESAALDSEWTWTQTDKGRAAGKGYADREAAAIAAVNTFYPKESWMGLVTNQNTELGYLEWALNASLSYVGALEAA